MLNNNRYLIPALEEVPDKKEAARQRGLRISGLTFLSRTSGVRLAPSTFKPD
jgi:hypothetical protein